MSAPQEQGQPLEIPSQLYNKLAKWCHTPYVTMDNDAVFEWVELLSTQVFTDVVLKDTPDNLIGLLRAFSAFPYHEDLEAAREGVVSFSITIRDPPEQEGSPQEDEDEDVFGSLPVLLSKALCMMTGLRHISLDLKPFTVEDGRELYNAVMSTAPLVIWSEMRSIRIRGCHVLPACIMSRCNHLQLKTLDLDCWINSRAFEKSRVTYNLKRLRLYYDKDYIPSPAHDSIEFPSMHKSTWNELSFNGNSRDFIILQEADCDRTNEFVRPSDVGKIADAFKTVRSGVKAIGLTRLAFHFDYRRFSPAIIRFDLDMGFSARPLNDQEIMEWHLKWIEYLMQAETLQKGWVFVYSSLAFVGTRNSDNTVSVERCQLDGRPDQMGFP